MSEITNFSEQKILSDGRQFVRLIFSSSGGLKITIERYSDGWASVHWPTEMKITDWLESVLLDDTIGSEVSGEIYKKVGDNISFTRLPTEEITDCFIEFNNITFFAIESSSGDYEVTWDRNPFPENSMNEKTILFKQSGLSSDIFIGKNMEKNQFPNFSMKVLENYILPELYQEKYRNLRQIEAVLETPWGELPKYKGGYDFKRSIEDSKNKYNKNIHSSPNQDDPQRKVPPKMKDLDKKSTPDRVQDQALSLLEDARDNGTVKKGTNETTKAIERGDAELVLVAKNVQPKEIVEHIPKLAEEKDIPYLMIDTQKEIGHAAGLEVGSAAAAVTELTNTPERLDEMGSTIEDISDDDDTEEDIWKEL
jgi:large subunit ribosomal protein L7Ae